GQRVGTRVEVALAQAPGGQLGRPGVDDEDVGVRDPPPHLRGVEHHEALATIAADVSVVGRLRLLDIPPDDSNDVRAEVGEKRARGPGRTRVAELEHPDAGERRLHGLVAGIAGCQGHRGDSSPCGASVTSQCATTAASGRHGRLTRHIPCRTYPSVVHELARVLADRRWLVLGGAGVSTDSGIPDYRGPGSPARTPMTYQQFVSAPQMQQRYWARAHVGWSRMKAAEPN